MPAVAVDLEEVKRKTEEWVPPTAFVGQDVLWYPSGSRNDDFHRAVCIRIWAGMRLKLNLTSGRIARTYTDAVRHIDDPYFMTHPLARKEDGAWDFTPAYKAQLEREKLLGEELADLKSRLEALESKKK